MTTRIKDQKSKAIKPGSKVKSAVKSSVAVKSASKVVKKKIVKSPEKNVKAEKTKVSEVHSTSSAKLKLDVYNTKGKVAGQIDLPKEIFGEKVNKDLIAQAVRVYLANQRSGTASTKTRGEVRGSTRKIYRQKGTGRARHGGIRAPIFVHGGIAFGPKPRDFSLKLSKKMKRKALISALSSKVTDNQIKIVSGLENLEAKTKFMFEVVKNLGLENKKILLVLPNSEESAQDLREKLIKISRNIKNLSYIQAANLNTYQTLNNNAMILLKDSVESIKKSFGGKE